MSGYIRPVDNTATQHNGTEGLAIDSLARRVLALAALNISAPFSRNSYPCVPISKHLIVKSGPFVHLTEAATLRFLAEKTSIPVPHVQCAFIHKNQAVIVMERIQGISVAEARFGSFKTVQDFHLWLRHELRPEDHPEREDDQDWKDIKDMTAKQDGPWPPPVFTHGDLNPSNILVHGTRVTGIIDWEFAGWYPHYWEYTSAWYWALLRPWWQDALPNFLNPHPEALAMEITRQKWRGE